MRVSFASLYIILSALATATFAIVAAMWVARRRRDVDLRAHGNPLLVMPSMAATVAPLVMRTTGERSAVSRPLTPHELAVANHVPQANGAIPLSGPISALADPVTVTTGRFAPGTVPPDVVIGHSLRFHRPAAGTLQFLAGHLEVIGGPDAGHEVRFVRPAPGDTADVTFGRKDGTPYRHIQLLEPTVSRTHARLSPDGAGWRLVNLSRTNPVVVNGEPLDGVQSTHLLKHEDLIEMGALVFRYHAR